jgi:hypothetical protein
MSDHCCFLSFVCHVYASLGAAKDRLETLSTSPTASTFSHLRTLTLVLAILGHDIAGIVALVSSLGALSTTKILLYAFDMGIVLVEGIKTILHYGGLVKGQETERPMTPPCLKPSSP